MLFNTNTERGVIRFIPACPPPPYRELLRTVDRGKTLEEQIYRSVKRHKYCTLYLLLTITVVLYSCANAEIAKYRTTVMFLYT